jgi:hypothetical protein
MPGFKDSLSENEMWQVSALLVKAEQLPAEVSAKLKPKDVTDRLLTNLKTQIPSSK